MPFPLSPLLWFTLATAAHAGGGECPAQFRDLPKLPKPKTLTDDAALAALRDKGLVVDLNLKPLERGKLSTLFDKDGLDAQSIMRGKTSGPVTYVIDQQDRIYLSATSLPNQKTGPLLVHNSGGSGELIEPKEIGSLSYDRGTKKWAFDASFSQANSQEEQAAAASAQEAAIPPGTTLDQAAANFKGMTKTEFFSCADKTALNTHWLNFLGTTIGLDLTIQAGTMAETGQLKTQEGRAAAAARLGWILVMDMQIKSLDMALFKRLGQAGLGHASQLALMTGLKLPLSYADKLLNEKWTKMIVNELGGSPKSEGKNSRSDKLAKANADANFQMSLFKIPEGTILDYFLINQLPALTMALCQVNPKLSWAINNQSVRIIERSALGAVTTIYVGKKLAPLLEQKGEPQK